jgi:hypothetical protein
VLAAFLPATIAALLLFFALISFFWNRSIYRDAAAEIPHIVTELASRDNVSSDALEALQGIDRIRRYHEKMTGFSLFRRLGMRQPGELARETFRIFRDELQARVLRPTFQRAQEIAVDPAKDFATRADAFYSVVWLRQGNLVEYGDDLKGFEGIWSGLGPEQAAEARQLLVQQFEHLIRNGPTQKNLFEGFDLAAVAEALRKGTADMGSTSAIKRYIGFQDACASPGTPNEIRRCDKLVRDILNFGQRDLARLSSNLQRLKTDLRELHDVEAGADEALESLREITLPERTSEQCFETFEKDIVPSMKDYYVGRQDELVKQCQSVVDQKSKAAVHTTLDAQDADLQKQQTAIADKVSQFNEACRASLERTGSVDPVPLFKLSRDYRRVECVRERDLSGDLVKKAAVAPAGGGVRPPPRPVGGVRPPPAVAEVGGLKFFSRGGGVPSGYNQDAFDRTKTEQAEEIEYAKGLPQAQKATKDSQVRRAIDDFGTAYERAWEQYLRAIRLKGDPPADPGAWIQALAQSGEWRTVLEPAADAVGLAGDPADPHFGGFYRKLQGLSSVSTFLNSGLGTYTGLLKKVGLDVARCQSNPAIAGQFRSALAAGDPSNSLVNADSWVDQNGGSRWRRKPARSASSAR